MRFKSRNTVFVILILFLASCTTPPVPPEAKEVHFLEESLRRTGASDYALVEFKRFSAEYESVRDELLGEGAKFGWLRDYDVVRERLKKLVVEGQALLEKVQERKAQRSALITSQLAGVKERIGLVKNITQSINECQDVRKNLIQAELAWQEAKLLFEKNKWSEVMQRISVARTFLSRSEGAMYNLLERYNNESNVEKWKTWAKQTIAESEKRRVVAIIVDKLARKLTVYKNGKAVGTYDIGLGRYGLSEKLHNGDDATPEGKYKVIRKFPNSLYYKALLINYPNEDDLNRYAQAKKNGLVPRYESVGGDIEIHGGGTDNITRGCVSVENEIMDKIYPLVDIGTLITIVGTVDWNNSVLKILRNM